jgi:murein DD-endopeptidase MepM/ murein hydrolase activator NlpD
VIAVGSEPRSQPRRQVLGALLAILLLVVLLVGSVSDSIGDKQQRLRGLNGQIIATRSALGQMVAQERALNAQIAALNAQLTQIAEQIQQETAKLDLLRLQVQAAIQQLADKKAELAQRIIDFGKRMRLMYKSRQVSPLALILGAANFTDLLNRIIFFRDIVNEDRRQTEILRTERLAIEQMKTELEGKQAQQQQVVKSISDQQAQVQALRQQRVSAEQQVAALAAQFQRQLSDMQAQRAALQAQLARLFAESLRARSSGKWIWPIDGFITQGFGCTAILFEPYDPTCASRHFHSGIDIATDYGSPVHAADGGIVHNYVMACSWNPGLLCGYGRYVIVVHAGGFTSLYGHMSGWAVADGTQVAKDTVIGYEGSTGASTGPHLHFEIDLGGNPVDPLAYLPGP